MTGGGPITAKEARKLIGKPVKYRNIREWHLESPHEGIIEDVQWQNVQIQGRWLWLPDLSITEVNT